MRMKWENTNVRSLNCQPAPRHYRIPALTHSEHFRNNPSLPPHASSMKNLPFCAAPWGSPLLATWDATPVMNHLTKPIRSSHLLCWTLLFFFFFNTLKPQLRPVTVNLGKKKKVIWSSEKTHDVTQDLGLTLKSQSFQAPLQPASKPVIPTKRNETCACIWQFNLSKCVFFHLPQVPRLAYGWTSPQAKEVLTSGMPQQALTKLLSMLEPTLKRHA